VINQKRKNEEKRKKKKEKNVEIVVRKEIRN